MGKAAARKRTSEGAVVVVPLIVGGGVGHQSIGRNTGSRGADIALSRGVVPECTQQLGSAARHFGNRAKP